jgi:signal peptidase I
VELLRRLRRNSLVELVLTVAIGLLFAFTVEAYAVKPYRIPSGSMEPTLKVGERVLVNRIDHRLGGSPKVGDVVVFQPPTNALAMSCADPHAGSGSQRPCDVAGTGNGPEVFIKRVVAVGGDTIAIRNGHVIRNGKLVNEPFTLPCSGGNGCDFPQPITVPRGDIFLMGDNRGQSDDSRYWGPVSVSRVIGEAFVSYWPPTRLGGL